MSKLLRSVRRSLRQTLFLAFILPPAVAFGAERTPLTGLFHNEDCTQIFYTQDFPPGKAGEVIDKYVDVMAGAGVKVFLCNTNARRTNYQSRVWDSFWDGYDPIGPDDQALLKPVPADGIRTYRKIVAADQRELTIQRIEAALEGQL